MAENQETYKTTIEVETADAAKNVDLLNKTVSTSLGEFDNLNEAISKTQDTLGKLDPKSAEFKELSKELSDLKDNLRDTEIQSVRFTEALAAQPGVIGFVGQSLEGLRGTFQVFMANPIIAVLAGIAGAFLALRESLTRTEEGTEKLNKITAGFTKILNGLFAIIEPIAMQLADLVGGLLENEKVMDGLSKTVGVLTGVFTTLFGTLKTTASFIIDTLVTNFNTLIGVAKGAGDVIAGVFTFDWDRIKEGANAAFDAVTEGVKGTIDNVKDLGIGIVDAAVDGFKAGEESFKKGFKRLTESQQEEADKAAEERKAAAEEAAKIETEAYLALLDDRNRELTERETKYQEDLKKLKAAGITDFTNLEEVYRRDVADINKRFDDEALAKQEEENNKLKEQRQRFRDERLLETENDFILLDQQYAREIAMINDKEKLGILSSSDASAERKRLQEERYNEQIGIIDEQTRILLENEELTEAEKTRIMQEGQFARDEINMLRKEDELLSLELEFEELGLTFDRRRELINEKESMLLEDASLTEEQRTAIKKAAAMERQAIDDAELEHKVAVQNAQYDLIGQFGAFLGQIAGENKKLQIAAVIAEQVASIGRIISNTAVANAKAVAASPLTFGQPWVTINTVSAALGIASSVAAGVKAVRDINNSDKQTSAPSSGGARPARPASPGSAAASIPQTVATGGEQNTGSQIAGAIAGAQQNDSERPIKAYVVSSDVSSQQALDRRTNSAATVG